MALRGYKQGFGPAYAIRLACTLIVVVVFETVLRGAHGKSKRNV